MRIPFPYSVMLGRRTLALFNEFPFAYNTSPHALALADRLRTWVGGCMVVRRRRLLKTITLPCTRLPCWGYI